MNTTLHRRLEKLESVNAPDVSRLLILGRYDTPYADVIGLRGGGPRLPDDVMRLPGETVAELHARAAALVTGPGPLLLGVLYAELNN